MTAKLRATHAQHLAIFTKIDLSALAKVAAPAAHSGIECYPIPQLPSLNGGTNFGDLARRFMAHHQGRHAAARASIPAMYVAAADTAGFDFDENILGTDRRHRHVGKRELLVFREEKGLHKIRIPILSRLLSRH